MEYANYPEFKWYLGRVQRAYAITAAGGRIQMGWAGAGLDAAGWRDEFVGALERRLTARMPNLPTGRKAEPVWQNGMMRDGRLINEIAPRGRRGRLRVRASEICTDNWRRRFAHLFIAPGDD